MLVANQLSAVASGHTDTHTPSSNLVKWGGLFAGSLPVAVDMQ